MTDEQRKLRSVRNMIDVLRFFGDNKCISYSYAYTFLFVLDIAEGYLATAIELLEDERPELYRHELKKLINTTEKSIGHTQSIVRKYITGESYTNIMDRLYEYQQKFKTEVFMLYNIMLRQSAVRWFKGDYTLAKICTQLDFVHLVLVYWMRMSGDVVKGMPTPLNKTKNNYDTYILQAIASIKHFINHRDVLDRKEMEGLTKSQENEFNSAFKNFVLRLTDLFGDMMESKKSA